MGPGTLAPSGRPSLSPLVRRPSVLILDEPTSALDGETEALVAQRLRGALPHATIILITHKPALARIADRIVTVTDGQAYVAQQPEPAHA